jgi:hypothetical protein
MTEPSPGPEDLPAIRARVPTHVFSGQISTGVIIVTGPMEFLLDFVRSLPRPNAIVSRVVLPHSVMPQFIQALEKNIDLYHQRFGAIPGEESSHVGLVSRDFTGNPAGGDPHGQAPSLNPSSSQGSGQDNQTTDGSSPTGPVEPFGGSIDVHAGSASPASKPPERAEERHHADHRASHVPTPQDIYDELKLRDELLSGAYANAVMIGHGPYEFSFDFITNFYPQSAVSSRVFMAAGHVPRLLESLKASWDQFRPRMQGGETE